MLPLLYGPNNDDAELEHNIIALPLTESQLEHLKVKNQLFKSQQQQLS